MRSLLKTSTVVAAFAVAATGGVATEVAAPAPAEAGGHKTATSHDRLAATKLAKSRVGKTPYRYGGTSLTKGADCSGFVQTVFAKQGVKLPRTAAQQKSAVRRIDRTWLRAGDFVFYGSYHVGIYVGDGKIVDAPSSGRKVSKRTMWAGERSYGTLRPA